MKIQITSGGEYEVEEHPLSGRKVRTRYFGEATVVGIRAGVRDARERFAFVLRQGRVYKLASRVNFTVLEEQDQERMMIRALAGACEATVTNPRA